MLRVAEDFVLAFKHRLPYIVVVVEARVCAAWTCCVERFETAFDSLWFIL